MSGPLSRVAIGREACFEARCDASVGHLPISSVFPARGRGVTARIGARLQTVSAQNIELPDRSGTRNNVAEQLPECQSGDATPIASRRVTHTHARARRGARSPGGFDRRPLRLRPTVAGGLSGARVASRERVVHGAAVLHGRVRAGRARSRTRPVIARRRTAAVAGAGLSTAAGEHGEKSDGHSQGPGGGRRRRVAGTMRIAHGERLRRGTMRCAATGAPRAARTGDDPASCGAVSRPTRSAGARAVAKPSPGAGARAAELPTARRQSRPLRGRGPYENASCTGPWYAGVDSPAQPAFLDGGNDAHHDHAP